MLPRTALRRAAARGATPLLAVRHISIAAARVSIDYSARPSPIALGKRPAVPGGFAAPALGASSRQFSWSPWSKPAAPANVEEPLSASAAAPAPEPILTSSHPDLTSTSPTATAPPVAEHAPSTSGTVTSDATSAATSAQPLLPDPSLLPQPPADAVTPTLENLVLHSGKPLEEVLNSPEAIHAAMKVSDLKLIGLDHSFFNPSGWARDMFVMVHDLGVPWWGVVILVSVGMRLALIPLTISSQKHNNRWTEAQPEFLALQQESAKALKSGDEYAKNIVNTRIRTLFEKYDVHPLRVLKLPLIQFPMFLVFFNALRGLADLPLPQLKEGGFGWITDLTVADPYMILPLTSVLFTNLMVQYGSGVGTNKASQTEEALIKAGHIKNTVQLASLLTLYFMYQFPALLLIYWTTSSALTLLQSLCLKRPAVQRLLNIPVQEVDPLDVVVVKPPTYMDTLRLVPQWYRDTTERVQQQAQAQHDAQVASRRRPVPTGKFEERILERAGDESGKRATKQAAEVAPVEEVIHEAAALAHAEESGGKSGVETVDEKKQRVIEARRRRARK